MTLRDLRIAFVKKCGRYDLVDAANEEDPWEDNGANFYLQSGQRYLDRQGDFHTGQIGEFLGTLQRGVSELYVPYLWNIHSVRAHCERWPSGVWADLRPVHSPTALCCRRRGLHWYYAKPILRVGQEKLSRTSAAKLQVSARSMALSATEESRNGLKLEFPYVPPDQSMDVLIVGNFYSKPLEEDSDQNYWSDYHPEILLKAALYELEVFYRNSEGAKDWMTAIQADLQDLHTSELLTTLEGMPTEMGE